RCPDGEFRVLEDNLRAPSGLAYLLAAREAVGPLILASGLSPRGLDCALDALNGALRAAAPADVKDPNIVLLSDGPSSSAFYEHRELARLLGLRVATIGDLLRDGEHLLVRGHGDDRVEREVHVVYRRIDDERLTLPGGRPTKLGELMLEPLLAGRLGCVNSPGSGIADDKAIHTYVERMIDFYLGEAPVLPSVPGYDLGDPAQLERALPRLDELVVKPRSEFGGSGVVVGPLASNEQRRTSREMVQEHPERFVAQEAVALSIHPTVVGGVGGGLRGRHVDLRPFVISSGEEVTVVPGGLTRFALREGEMVVNSGQGGGAKDTWII
ncbi:MAG: circularly permuted type 2 ATP-grasp protein, partial [Solirubrobacterales bacterium]|nr:circularly permuted type 2 ATP-grasp protein [Solirubrobacterales bacterium]